MNAPSAARSKPRAGNTTSAFSFPKDRRLLRTSDFRKVYQEGFRMAGPLFAAFCLQQDVAGGPKIGFTVPRALGKAVVRNRLKRRMRESVRLRMGGLPPGWMIVFNPRRAALEAPFEMLLREVERVFHRCGG